VAGSANSVDLRSGAAVPVKLWHALEVAGDAAVATKGISALPPGTVGASPAATAAWLGWRVAPGHDLCRRYLEEVVRQYGGPAPCATPITVFERAWVLSAFAQAGIRTTLPTGLLASLRCAAAADGAAAGPGLPPDADTTAAALYALTRFGELHEPSSLWPYQAETHFCTWRGEEGQSVTVNAHVLEAFGQYLRTRPQAPPRYAGAVRQLTH
jgi:halimadienyl-diphosphate synthase